MCLLQRQHGNILSNYSELNKLVPLDMPTLFAWADRVLHLVILPKNNLKWHHVMSSLE